MLRLQSEITVGTLKFTFVTQVNILSSWETLTDTAIIQLPNKLRLKNEEIIDKIKAGDEVEIKLGYYPNLETRFIGYVTKVVPESPMQIFCEDEMFNLKKSSIRNYSKKNLTLETLITDNYSGETNIVDAKVGAFRIDSNTLVQVLQELRNKYGIYSWFRNGVLNSGVPFTGQDQTTFKFDFQFNIIDGKNLRYTLADDLNTISHGISEQPDGTKVEVFTFYDANGNIKTQTTKPEGDLNTLRTPNKTQAELTELTERRLPNLYYTGYRGSFVTFGQYNVKHGDVADLTDVKFPERDGQYLIKSVSDDFGLNGYRQIIELDRKIS